MTASDRGESSPNGAPSRESNPYPLTMADIEQNNTPAAQPVFGIQRIFLKGQSLELPQGAQVFLETQPAAMNLNLQVENSQLADGVYEVLVRATLTADVNGKTMFLLEVDQAGIFEVRNVEQQQLIDILEIGAPSILSPYLRSQLSATLTQATLPMFYMPEINWPVLAQQRRAEAAAAAQAGAANDAKLH